MGVSLAVAVGHYCVFNAGMYEFLVTLLWLSVAIPFVGFGYCLRIERSDEDISANRRVRLGLIAGLVASGAHLAQAIGLNLSVAHGAHSGSLLGLLWFWVPIAGIGLALMSLALIQVYGERAVRSIGTISAVIVGGSMVALVALFMIGFGSP
jgi:hypothetical protein